MKQKANHVYIQPISNKAKDLFEEHFRKLHTCKVIEEKLNKLLVKSIAGEFYFWIHKSSDMNWKLIK